MKRSDGLRIEAQIATMRALLETLMAESLIRDERPTVELLPRLRAELLEQLVEESREGRNDRDAKAFRTEAHRVANEIVDTVGAMVAPCDLDPAGEPRPEPIPDAGRMH